MPWPADRVVHSLSSLGMLCHVGVYANGGRFSEACAVSLSQQAKCRPGPKNTNPGASEQSPHPHSSKLSQRLRATLRPGTDPGVFATGSARKATGPQL